MGLEEMARAADAAVEGELQVEEAGPVGAEQAPPVEAGPGEAIMLVNLLADGVESVYDCLQYSPEIREQAAERLDPLLKKYNIGGGLLEKWGVEIMAGMFFSGVIVNSVKAVRQSRAEKAKAVGVAKPEKLDPAQNPASMLEPA